MFDDTVLAAIKALSDKYITMRSGAISRGLTHRESFINEALPEPSAGFAPVRVFDQELLAYLKEQGVETTMQAVNEACVRLIGQNKITLVNTDHVRVLQEGHLFELKKTLPPVPEPVRRVLVIIAGLENVCRIASRPLSFTDWEIYHGLANMGFPTTIQDVHRILIGVVSLGKIKFSGDVQWFNPAGDGYTFDILPEVK